MQNYALLKNLLNSKSSFAVSIALFVFVAIGNLVCTNILSTQGINVSSSEIETLKLEKENQILQVKIEEESRLKELEANAFKSGFVRTNNLVFAPTPATVALR